jgi:mono/diheme cytochrome c family protein
MLTAIFTLIYTSNITTADNFVFEAQTNSDQEISAKLYQNNCAKCHGANGEGSKGPNLTSEKKQAKWKDSDEKLIKKITNGDWGMPAFGKKLKPEEIKAIATYVRTFKSAQSDGANQTNSSRNSNNNSTDGSNKNSNKN